MADYAPFSGHQLYAPKGTGTLYARARRPLYRAPWPMAAKKAAAAPAPKTCPA